MRGINKLSARTIATAKCTNKSAAVFSDGGGLYLRVTPTGAKSWIFRYMFAGRSHDVGLGPTHTVTLAEARDAARELRKLKYAGDDPLLSRRAARVRVTIPTFRDFAEEYITKQAPGWRGARTENDWRTTMAQHVYPAIGQLPVDKIDTQAVLRAISPLWAKRPEQGSRVRGRVETVLDAAAAAGHRDPSIPNPARWVHLQYLLTARAPSVEDKGHPSMPYTELPDFLTKLRQRKGVTPRAMEFAILTAARVGEVCGMQRSEIAWDDRQWVVPAERMKAGQDHRVPLSERALAILQATEGRPFSGTSPSAFRKLLAAMNYSVAPHGFRKTFGTWCREVDETPAEVREMALAHKEKDRIAAAYNGAELLRQRRGLADRWAAFCYGTPADTNVIPLRA
jgi:integrase